MANKVTLPFDRFKTFTAGGAAKLIEFLTKQRIGKVEFTSEPWSFDDDLKDMPQQYKDKFGGSRVTKWVVDIENGKFIKLVNGKVDHQETLTVGDAIGEINDLIKMYSKNKYTSVNIFRRKSVPGKDANKWKYESMKKRPNARLVLEGLIKTIIKEEVQRLKESSEWNTPVLRQYLETALWSSTDDEGDSLDGNYEVSDFAPEAISRAKKDVAAFLLKARKVLPKDVDMTDVGHDFWLSRNGHGAGFFDADYLDDDQQKQLQDIAEKSREVDLYVGDDGKLYFQ